MSKALRVVARLRKLAIDEARIELAARLATEARAAEANQEAQASLARERAIATALDPVDGAFAAWLPRGLQTRDTAKAAAAIATDAAQEGRAILAAARASAEALEKMLAKEAAEQRADATRREQAVLDEAGLRASQPTEMRSIPRR